MNLHPATNPEHALERVRTGLGATQGSKATAWTLPYAHHGQIRCYKISHPNPWCWEAECDCGWRIDAAAFDWPCAYWALVQHQTDLEPRWIVYPGFGPRWDDDSLDRAHNEGIRA